ncbi:hypothetical protein J7J63_02515 [Candidatus Bipolaricaulota bacterium]|nr:hypothetical protein [Candidatus Bipolaricaulota bacterium]
MAIKVLDSQGTKVYVLDVPDPAFVDCTAAVTAIKAGKLVGCPQSLGDITETRASTEYKCLSSNESAKALGGISRGSLELGLLLDPVDAAGQGALKTAFKDNTKVIVGIELPDNESTLPETTGNGTIYWFVASVSGVATGIAMDAAITYTVTLEIGSDITECPAVKVP